MNLRREFIAWYFNEFVSDSLFIGMIGMTEDSPWHRENDVGIHTNMVVAQYVTSVSPSEDWIMDDLLGAFACAFHDVGKPDSVEHKWKEERGNYKSFPGHELMSARLWEDWAVRNWSRLSLFGLRSSDIYRVGWIIEHHLPWAITNTQKLDNMAQTIIRICKWSGVFTDVLIADTTGRISDDAPEKLAKAKSWCSEFLDRCAVLESNMDSNTLKSLNKDGNPVMLMMIAPSGSGKSTFVKMNGSLLCDGSYETYSWDQLRLNWYSEDYAEAYRLSTEDKEFNSKAQKVFTDLVKSGVPLVIDNVSTSTKRRRFFIDQAHQRGYWVIAVLLPTSLNVIIDRQTTRPDKTVPEDAVRRQYMNLQLPSYGEFDEIIVSDWNFKSQLV